MISGNNWPVILLLLKPTDLTLRNIDLHKGETTDANRWNV